MPSIENSYFCNNSPEHVFGEWIDNGGNVFDDDCGVGDEDGDGVSDDIDNCYLYNPDQADCNMNTIGDVCDLADGTSEDCNGNGILDDCDIVDGGVDCNANGIPDDCELTDNDCNANGVLDDCESDCDANGTPDDCDIASGAGDCNADGVPDSCQLTDNDCINGYNDRMNSMHIFPSPLSLGQLRNR